MQIQHITAKNFVGARAIDVEITTPITLFAGTNGAGKSSVREAVSAALSGDVSRVALKKEYPSMVSEGAKKGMVAIETDAGTASLTLPDGKHVGLTVYTGALPYLLNPERFAQMKADERRTFLFDLTGLRATPEKIKAMLVARSLDEKKIEKVLPMLRSGFPAAVKFAEDEAREAKGAWKAVTAEQWGKDKAEGWEAEIPSFDAKRHSDVSEKLKASEGRVAEANTQLGALQEKHRAYQASRNAATRSAELAESVTRIESKLETDKANLDAAETTLREAEQRAGTAPREGLVHDLARGVGDFAAIMANSNGVAGYHQNGEIATWDEFDLTGVANALQAYEEQFGPLEQKDGDADARARLPDLAKARDLMKRAVENDERDLAAARAATEALKLQSDVEAVTDEQVNGARTTATAATAQRDALRTELDRLNTAKRAADAAADKTKTAVAHHVDIIQWLDIAGALAPDGIPGEMLAQAIAPINGRLAELAAFAEWAVPALDSDMSIRADGRLYSLLSESEKYRADALFALTIAVLSETRIAFFDRFDVLDLKGRADLLALLDDMATQGEISTALVFGTLKKLPEGLPETIRAHWIENGELLATRVAEAA